MYQQAVLPVVDPHGFGVVHQAIAAVFSSERIPEFLRSIERARIRIRDFETVLGRKLIGEPALAEYARLSNADQGQIREFYLASLEKVAPDLRQKFFKLYAYY